MGHSIIKGGWSQQPGVEAIFLGGWKRQGVNCSTPSEVNINMNSGLS